MSKTRSKNDPAKTDEVVGKLEAMTAKPASEGIIASVLGKVLGLRDKNRRKCECCGELCSSYSTGAYKTYYRCDNRLKTGCKFTYSIVHPNIQEKLRRQAKGEHVKSPVKDQGNYGGIERVE
jgi:hypothetical protein